MSALLLAVGSMSAQNLIGLDSRADVVSNDGVTEYKGEAISQPVIAKGAILPDIIGKKYVTYYGSFDNYGKCAGHFTVEKAGGDTVILKEILGDYDLKGIYNKEAGTVTIPTGQVVGTYSTYGDVTSYTLLAPAFTQFSRTEPCVLTFTDEGVTFNNGLYASISQGGMAFMKEITTKDANGTFKVDQYNSAGAQVAQYNYPVFFSTVSDTKITVQGMAAWLYGHDYNVDFNIAGTSATLPDTCPVDYNNSTSGGEQTFYLLSHSGSGVSPNPTFTVTKENQGKSITLTATTNLFWGYEKSAGSWSGFFLRNMVLQYTEPQNAVGTIEAQGEKVVNVYNMQGVRIRANVMEQDATENLPAGLYIVGGKKVLVTK